MILFGARIRSIYGRRGLQIRPKLDIIRTGGQKIGKPTSGSIRVGVLLNSCKTGFGFYKRYLNTEIFSLFTEARLLTASAASSTIVNVYFCLVNVTSYILGEDLYERKAKFLLPYGFG